MVGCFFILTNWAIHTILHRYLSFTFYVGSPDQFYTFFDLMILNLYDLYVIFKKDLKPNVMKIKTFCYFNFMLDVFGSTLKITLDLLYISVATYRLCSVINNLML